MVIFFPQSTQKNFYKQNEFMIITFTNLDVVSIFMRSKIAEKIMKETPFYKRWWWKFKWFLWLKFYKKNY